MMKKVTINSLAAAVLMTASGNAEEWKSSFDLGATLTEGNSESLLVTMGFVTEKIEKQNEYRANLFYTYGEEASNATNDELFGNAAWRHLHSDKFYSGARFDFRKDEIAEIDYRAALTGLFGYYVIKDSSTSLAFEGGLGLTYEELGGISNNYVHAYIGEFFEHKFNDKTKIYQSLSLVAPVDNTDAHLVVGEIGVETSLSDTLSLKVYVQNKYDAQPAAGKDDNDLKVVTGISYKF